MPFQRHKSKNKKFFRKKKEMCIRDRDKDFREMVEQELNDSRKQLEVIADELKILLLPKDPNDDRNVIVKSVAVQAVKRPVSYTHLKSYRTYRWYTVIGSNQLRKKT